MNDNLDPNKVYFDQSNHRVRYKESRKDGNALFEDITDGSKIICKPDAVSIHPRATEMKVAA